MAKRKTTPKRGRATVARAPLMMIETAPARVIAAPTERYHDYGDVEVETAGEVPEGYTAYPVPDIDPIDQEYGEADIGQSDDEIPSYDELIELGDRMLAEQEEGIEWLPTFDEVYDYIDALVEEFDLDAHELFELAFGYSDDQAT